MPPLQWLCAWEFYNLLAGKIFEKIHNNSGLGGGAEMMIYIDDKAHYIDSRGGYTFFCAFNLKY